MTEKQQQFLFGLPVGVAMTLLVQLAAVFIWGGTIMTKVSDIEGDYKELQGHGERLARVETVVPKLEQQLDKINTKLDRLLIRQAGRRQ